MFLRKSARVVAAAAALTLAAAVPAVADGHDELPEDPEIPIIDDDDDDGADAPVDDEGTEPEEGGETPEVGDEDSEVAEKESPEEEIPEVGTFALPDPGETVEFTIANITDFHGRIGEVSSEGVVSGPGLELACYATTNPEAYLTSSGDNTGATPFISSAQDDYPTLDLLNAVGLQVSAVGNHELDYGWDGSIGLDAKAEYSNFSLLAANMNGGPSELNVGDYEIVDFDGVNVAFVGAVTEELPSLITPSFLDGVELGSIVDSVNDVAAQLTDGDEANGEADLVVALIHEDMAFIADELENVDLAFGGHTHVQWSNGSDVPLVANQAGQYGEAIVEVSVTATSEGFEFEAETTPLSAFGIDCGGPIADEAEEIIAQAAEAADEIGSQRLGYIAGDFNRAQGAEGEENRGEESTVGNMVADAQLWAVNNSEHVADADFSFMNPGGLRTDLRYNDEEDGVITLGEAAAMQPFANTLFVLTMTGADIVGVLNEQVQPASASRPYLKLGVSGLVYEYDAHTLLVNEVWLDNGEPLDLDAEYRVVANSFLVPGGDNFTSFTNASDVNDTGIIDLDAFVDFMDANAPDDAPLDPNGDTYGAQRSWGYADVGDRLASGVFTGMEISLDYSGLWFTTNETSNVSELGVYVDGDLVDTFEVTGDDADLVAKTTNYGRAEVRFAVPDLSGYDVGDEISLEVRAGDWVLTSETVEVAPVSISLANITDFHGRIGDPAVRLACYVEDSPHAYLTSSGDNIGATPFISSAQNDYPTIAALNALGLKVSAYGNHELDKGWDDYNAKAAEMQWNDLAANVTPLPSFEDAEGVPYVVGDYEIHTVDGVEVAFIGALTEDMPSLVTPTHLDHIEIADIAETVNTAAAEVRDQVDVVVVLVHEDMPTLEASFDEDLIDIAFGGHSHIQYTNNNDAPMLAIESGQYGEAITEVNISFGEDGELSFESEIIATSGLPLDCVGPVVSDVRAINAAAASVADEVGSWELGYIAGDFNRAIGIHPETGATEENRGEESTVGNLVADAQLWAVQQTEQFADTDLSFMNPGGLRTDLEYNEDADGVITLGEAAGMQPFANSLFVLTLTGQDVVDILNEQVQPEGSSRPFLKLGVSGLLYEYDIETLRVTDVWLENGQPLDLDAEYRVVANSFLVPGGDNFTSFTNASDVNDTGIIDLDAFVDFMDENAPEDAPLDPNGDRYGAQRSWGYQDVNGATTEPVDSGTEIALDYAGLWFTTGESSNAQNVTVEFDGDVIGTFPITGDDADLIAKTTNYGRAEVRVAIPDLSGYAEGEEIPFEIFAGDQQLAAWTLTIGAGIDGPGDGDGDGDGDETDKPGGKHPETGANVGGPLIAGLLLMGAGAVFLGARRKMLA